MQILQTCHHMLWKKKIKREVKPRKGLNPNTKTAYSCGLPCLRPGLPLERSKGFWAVELRERQASALQIHHLSLPLLISGKSVSATKGGGGGEGGREEREKEEAVWLVGEGVIRHHCLSPMPAGQYALDFSSMAWNIWVSVRWDQSRIREIGLPSVQKEEMWQNLTRIAVHAWDHQRTVIKHTACLKVAATHMHKQ